MAPWLLNTAARERREWAVVPFRFFRVDLVSTSKAPFFRHWVLHCTTDCSPSDRHPLLLASTRSATCFEDHLSPKNEKDWKRYA